VTTHAAHEAGEAYFDDTRTYRYALSRCWDPKKPMMLFVGLNPSTADENKLDPTLRRIRWFAQREWCGGFWVANLFAFRATKPENMMAAADPVGPDNDRWILDMARWSSLILVGWGANGGHRGRDMEVRKLLQGFDIHCLAKTKTGQPGHPLYLRGDTLLTPFQSHMWRPGE
jgi:hypothetical protein